MYWISSIGSVIYVVKPPLAKVCCCESWKGVVGLTLMSGASSYVGRKLSYVDLSMFQIVDGLRYAFPKMMTRLETGIPGLVALHDRVAQQPNVAAYLASERRLPFNVDGIFRHYPELEA